MRAPSSPLLLLLLPPLSACVDGPPKPAPDGVGAMLSVDLRGGTDVVGVHIEVERVACDASDAFTPLVVSADVDLIDGLVPGQIELLEQVLDPESRHLAADLFVALPPGCYSALAAPASALTAEGWTPSADCAAATAAPVVVVDGETAEQTLISQCVGDPGGALDTLVTLNHPPTLRLDFPVEDRDGDGVANGDDGKFNLECEPVEVCATVVDVDDDPVELDWSQLEGPPAAALTPGPLRVVGFDDGHRIWEQCLTVVTDAAGTHTLEAAAYDLGYAGGALVRIDSLVAPARSLDNLSFPVHTSWGEEPRCLDVDGEIVAVDGVEVHRAAGCDPTTPEEWYCGGLGSPDPTVAALVCEDGRLVEERLYPPCDADAGFVVGPDAAPDMLLDWSAALLEAVARGATAPPRASRQLALLHVAVFEAINGITGTHAAYAIALPAPAGAEVGAAAVGAAHAVLSASYPGELTRWDDLRRAHIAAMGARAGVWDGLAYGAEVAEALLDLRASDRSEDSVSYVVVDAPGLWRPTPPAYAPALLPQWGAQTPWTLSSAHIYRVTAPPALTSTTWAEAYTFTQALGGQVAPARTADETEIAHFWADGAGTVTPPGHWFEIAADVIVAEDMRFAEAAHLHALLGLAVADAGIIAWEAKYATNHVRPVTAIREDGDRDGNPATSADPTWTPLLTTPPFPEWVSGHATFSGAAAQVLARVVGTDAYPLTVRADPRSAVPGVERSFPSFSAAADEACMSRIYGGIHWIYAGHDGVEMGAQLADDIVDTALLPL